jgi:hypothetical protein
LLAPRCPRCRSSRIQRGYDEPPLFLRLLGYYDLFCNSCNLEFKGFAVPGALKRLPSTSEKFPDNKRRAHRRSVRLPLSVSVMEVEAVSGGLRYSPELAGHTRVINQFGMAIILPTVQIQNYNFADTNRRLLLKLHLPAGAIHLHVNPVNSQRLTGAGANAGWVIGARITKISDEDRERLARFLDSLDKGKP